jgi:hypothetical protein
MNRLIENEKFRPILDKVCAGEILIGHKSDNLCVESNSDKPMTNFLIKEKMLPYNK